MSTAQSDDRFVSAVDSVRYDEHGFIDPARSPRLLRIGDALDANLTWILAPPWLGKTTAAERLDNQLYAKPSRFGAAHHWLTRAGVGGSPLPQWWNAWVAAGEPSPVVWLVDGVDEDEGGHHLQDVLDAVCRAPPQHLEALRLVLFSRPRAELGQFRDAMERRIGGATAATRTATYWLTPLDRIAAESLVGRERFAAVTELVGRCGLQPIAGYPVVLNFLRRYPETVGLTLPLVWRGILTALLGERTTNPPARFASSQDDRFRAASRIAAVLALTNRDTIRAFSPDPTAATAATLYVNPDNVRHAAAVDALHSAAFRHLPERGAYRFAQRHLRDWFAAFDLERLPIPALRSALAGADGTLLPRMRETARLIHAATGRDEVRTEIDRLGSGALLPSDAAWATLGEAVRCLDRLEELAVGTPWGLRLGWEGDRQLARLRIDGIGPEVADRLRDARRPAAVKHLLLDTAEATGAVEAVEPAVEILLDAGQPDDLRVAALAAVLRLGGPAHLECLERPVAEGTGTDEVDRRLRCMLIYKLIERKAWPVWRAALHLPARNDDLGDERVLLPQRLSDAMTLADARHLLPHLVALARRDTDPKRPNRLPIQLRRAVELVAAQAQPGPDDWGPLVDFAVTLAADDTTWPVANEVAQKILHVPGARRRFYEHNLDIPAGGDAGQRIAVWPLLRPDDWHWLCEQAAGRWAGREEVWADAVRLADASQHTKEEYDAFCVAVERHVPGLRGKLAEDDRQRRVWLVRQEARQRAATRRDATRLPLAQRVRQILDDLRLSPANRMAELGWVCRARAVGLESQAVGEWDELPAALRDEAIDACRRGLENAVPTPIPSGNEFPGSILAEAGAFLMILSDDPAGWLTDGHVRRWLPTVLFAGSGDLSAVIRACHDAAPAATEDVLLDAVRDYVRRGRPYALRAIPSECWTDPIAARFEALVADEAVEVESRADLLVQLCERCPERAEPVAAAWAARPPGDSLSAAGRNVLLACNPAAAMAVVDEDVAARGTTALEELTVLWASRDELRARPEEWPVGLLRRLGLLLVRSYPPANDPPLVVGFVHPDFELRQLRDWVVARLEADEAPDARTALSELTAADDHLRRRVESHRATEEALGLLAAVDPLDARDPSAVPLPAAARLLDRADFRLVRRPGDLLDTVVECLRRVNADVGHDLEMLYGPPNSTGTRGPRKHLEEPALQAYLRRRLLELLPQMADGLSVQIVREDVVSRRQRYDLRVTAPLLGRRELATVVVEVKWSSNQETRTGLTDQLGDRYLRGEGLTHGVYVVGWCGEWFPGDGTGANRDPDALASFLIRQRDDYCRDGGRGAGLRVEPAVLNLAWRRS